MSGLKALELELPTRLIAVPLNPKKHGHLFANTKIDVSQSSEFALNLQPL